MKQKLEYHHASLAIAAMLLVHVLLRGASPWIEIPIAAAVGTTVFVALNWGYFWEEK
jgi:hypothetical protein